MLLVVDRCGLKDKRPCLSHKQNPQYVLWFDDLIIYIRDHMPWHRKSFFLYEGCFCCLVSPSGRVLLLMAVYSTARAWIFTGLNVIVQALHTNTSSVRSCLLQHLFIDCLVTFVWLSGNRRRTKKEHGEWVGLSTAERWKKKVVCFFFNAGTFFRLLLHSMKATFTHYPGSQSQLWAFLIRRNADRMAKKGKLSKRKKREA